MYGLSYVWHGLALNDLKDLRVPVEFYFALSALAYAIISLVLTFAVHQAIQHDWISLKRAFPFAAMLVGAIIGFAVYLIAYVFGMSFTGRELVHIVVDVLWQMVEQSLGGLAVSLGIIYDMNRTFMRSERVQ